MSDEITGAFTLSTTPVQVTSRFALTRFGAKLGATLTAIFYVAAGFGLGTLAGGLLGIIGQNVTAFAINGAIMGLGIGAAVGLPAAVGQLKDN